MKQHIAKVLVTIMVLTYGLPLLPVSTATLIPLSASTVSADVYEDSQQFPDVNLRSAITSWLGKSVTDTVYKSDIISRLPSSGQTFSANSQGILDLSGIEIFEGTGIRYLDLGHNSIQDLAPLAKLTSLEQLDVDNNQVTSLVPVQNLVNLKALAASSNSIQDLTPISSLNKLTSLELSSNAIADVTPLAGLINLTSLNLGMNDIGNITPLTALTNLQTLQLGSNNISDIIPLTGMTKLQILYLNLNNISDLSPIAALVGLTSLNIGSNVISDISPLSNLININQLLISSNNVNSITSLSDMKQLSNLQASQNLIHDLSPLAELSSLSYLNLQYNPIVSITPLSGLTNLSSLNLGNTFLNSFSGEGQTAANNITVLGTKKISPVVKYGVTSGSSLVHSIQVEAGKNVLPHYGFLQTSDGTNWSSSISWHQAFSDYYASTASTYSSADSTIATVDMNGAITGIAPGTTQITARLFGWASDYTEYTFVVIVEEPTPSETSTPTTMPTPVPAPSATPSPTSVEDVDNTVSWVEVTPEYSEIFPGESVQLKAEAHFVDGTTKDISNIAEWSLENPEVATIDKGLLTGREFGGSMINATWNGKTGSSGVAVKKITVLEITVTPDYSIIPVGDRQAFKAIAKYSNGTESDVTLEAFWWSATNSIAEVDQSGVVYGISAGTINIGASFGYTSGIVTVTISSATPAPVQTPEPSEAPILPIPTPEASITPSPFPSVAPSTEPPPTSVSSDEGTTKPTPGIDTAPNSTEEQPISSAAPPDGVALVEVEYPEQTEEPENITEILPSPGSETESNFSIKPVEETKEIVHPSGNNVIESLENKFNLENSNRPINHNNKRTTGTIRKEQELKLVNKAPVRAIPSPNIAPKSEQKKPPEPSIPSAKNPEPSPTVTLQKPFIPAKWIIGVSVVTIAAGFLWIILWKRRKKEERATDEE